MPTTTTDKAWLYKALWLINQIGQNLESSDDFDFTYHGLSSVINSQCCIKELILYIRTRKENNRNAEKYLYMVKLSIPKSQWRFITFRLILEYKDISKRLDFIRCFTFCEHLFLIHANMPGVHELETSFPSCWWIDCLSIHRCDKLRGKQLKLGHRHSIVWPVLDNVWRWSKCTKYPADCFTFH